jgi:hypothetical protein
MSKDVIFVPKPGIGYYSIRKSLSVFFLFSSSFVNIKKA